MIQIILQQTLAQDWISVGMVQPDSTFTISRFVTENLVAFVSALSAPILTLGGLGILRIHKYFRERKARLDLSHFYSPSELEEAIRYYVNTTAQDTDPSEQDELDPNNVSPSIRSLVRFFTKSVFDNNKNEQKFFLVLADTGMGKTTFLINLYLRYSRKWKINPNRLVYAPFGHEQLEDFLSKFVSDPIIASKTIVLLDGFDEDPFIGEDYSHRITEITGKLSSCRAVVITARTQLFPSEKHEPSKVGVMKFGGKKGEHSFQKIYITPFSKKDINTYLRKRFPVHRFFVRRRAHKVVNHSANLMARPFLLSHIDELLKTVNSFDVTYEIYEFLIEKWIQRERIEKKESLRHFCEELALEMFRNAKRRGGSFIRDPELITFAEQHSIGIEKDHLRRRSLLNRTGDGRVKFSHKSVLEYFLARRVVEEWNGALEREIDHTLFPMVALFEQEMVNKKILFPKFTVMAKNINIELHYGGNKKVKSVESMSFREFVNLSTALLREIKQDELEVIRYFPMTVEYPSYRVRPMTLWMAGTFHDIKVLTMRKYQFVHLRFFSNEEVDLAPISELESLRIFEPIGCRLKNAEAIGRIKRLVHLTLTFDQVQKNLGALRKLRDGITLEIRDNGLTVEQRQFLRKELPQLDLQYWRKIGAGVISARV